MGSGDGGGEASVRRSRSVCTAASLVFYSKKKVAVAVHFHHFCPPPPPPTYLLFFSFFLQLFENGGLQSAEREWKKNRKGAERQLSRIYNDIIPALDATHASDTWHHETKSSKWNNSLTARIILAACPHTNGRVHWMTPVSSAKELHLHRKNRCIFFSFSSAVCAVSWSHSN